MHRKIFTLAILSIVIALRSGKAHGQTVKQSKICSKYGLSAQTCAALVAPTVSFNADKLNSPETNLHTISEALGPIVLETSIKLGLQNKLSTDAQAALQALSTVGAVNQVGGAATAAGSTNLVAKPTTSDFISMASESGAFTDTVNGSTATIQANALGLLKYFNSIPIFGRWDYTGADLLQPLNFSVTLNIAQTGSTVAPTAGAANAATPASITNIFLPTNDASLSSFGMTYAFHRKLNPQSKAAQTAWSSAVTASKTSQPTTVKIDADLGKLLPGASPAAILSSIGIASLYSTWLVDEAAALKIADPDSQFNALAQAYAKYLKAYCRALTATPTGLANAEAFLEDVETFRDGVYGILDQARGAPIANVAYTYAPSAQMPATHSFTASVAYSFAGTKSANTADNEPTQTRKWWAGAQLTGNFTVAIFASVPSGASYGRLKDYQSSAEFDLPVGGTVAKPLGTLSFAGYGQYQYNATVLNITSANEIPGTNIALPANAQTYLGTPGWLGVFQGKFVFNLKQGLSIPVAVKWSNKTDLSQAGANDVRGQVGISYDFSALSSLIK